LIIPTPRLERLPYNLHGLNYFQQIIYRWRFPPRYRLYGEYVITLDEDPEFGDGLELVHPDGFVIDGASVPRPCWPIIEPTGTLLEGSVPHDQWYQYGYMLARRKPGLIFNIASERLVKQFPYLFGDLVPVFIGRGQKFGDQLLRHITIEKHGATVDAGRAYRALRLFGWRSWNRYRRLGPTAYNDNSLGLPGVTERGVAF